MKYYKNLIKRKKYGVLAICLMMFLLGALCFYYNFLDVLIRNINWSNLSYYSGTISLLGSTNLGLSLLGLLVMFIGLVWMPVNSPYAQDDSDYDIKSEGEFIHIIFRNNEFLVKKETFQPTDLFFRDKNKRFVSMTRGYQIYNYIMTYCKDLTEKGIDKSKVILKSEVVNKFSNVKKLSQEEKIALINSQKIKNKPRLFFIFLSILLWVIFAFFSIGILGVIITRDFANFNFIVAIIIIIIFFILGKKSSVAIFKNINLIKRIMNEDMFIVECEIYDRKHNQTQDTNGTVYDNYYIKITDGNYIVDQWIKISKEKYEQNDNNVKLYIFDKTRNEYSFIC